MECRSDEVGGFSFPRNREWTNLDILYVSDQPEKECFLNKGIRAGRQIRTFLTLSAQVRTKFRQDWRLTHGTNLPDISEGFTFLSTKWLGATPKQADLDFQSREFIQLLVNRYNPKLIVALGKRTAKVLGLDRPIDKCRNRIFSVTHLGRTFNLLPTYGMSDLFNPRNGFKQETHVRIDLHKAYATAYKPPADDRAAALQKEIQHHRYYRTLAEVEAFYEWFKANKPDVLSVDFETNTVRAYDPGAKIIMAGFAMPGKIAWTILLDHRDHPEPENLPKIWAIVQTILEDRTIRKVNHNIKFDYQMAVMARYRIHIANIVWDTMLAEHLLHENKDKGYNLDVLTSEYEPGFTGYKDLIKPENDLLEEMEGKLAALASAHEQEVLDWKNKKSAWDADNAMALMKYEEAIVVYKRRKEEHTKITKAWKDAGSPKGEKPEKMPPRPKKPKAPTRPKKNEDLKALTERVKELKRDAKDQTFEDKDMHGLEVYCAIDADVTLRIAVKQKIFMHRENEEFLNGLVSFYTMNQHLPLPQNKPRPNHIAGTNEYGAALKEILAGIYPSTIDLMAEQVCHMPEAIGDMEYRGIAVDYDALNQMDREMASMKIAAEETIKKYAGDSDINIDSDKQMLGVLNIYQFEKILKEKNLPVHYTEANKQLSLKADFLEKWESAFREFKGNPCADLFSALVKYRKSNKCRETYLANYIKLGALDGHVHTQFMINGTLGARLSSNSPNLQNITKPSNLMGYNLKGLMVPTVIQGATHVRPTYTENDQHSYDATEEQNRLQRCISNPVDKFLPGVEQHTSGGLG